MVDVIDIAWSFLFYGRTNTLVYLFCGFALVLGTTALVVRLIRGRG